MIDLALYLGGSILAAAGLTWLKSFLGTLADLNPFTWSLAQLATLAAAGTIYFAGLGMGMILFVRNALSTAYPVFLGLSFVAMVGAAVLFLGERVTGQHLVGAGLIVAGAVCVSRSKS